MIRRAWYATTPEGPMMDRFANGLAGRVMNEIEPPMGGAVEMVEEWLKIADRMYTAAGEPMTASEVDAAVEDADLIELYDLTVGE